LNKPSKFQKINVLIALANARGINELKEVGFTWSQAGKILSMNEMKYKSGDIVTERHSKPDHQNILTIMAAAKMVPAAAEAYGRLATLAPSFKVS